MYYQVLCTSVYCVPFLLCAASRLVHTGWEPKWWLVDFCVFVAAEWSATSWKALLRAGQVILNFGFSRVMFFSVRGSVTFHKPELFG